MGSPNASDITPATPFQYDHRGGWVFVKTDGGEYVRVSDSRVPKEQLHQWLTERFEGYTPDLRLGHQDITDYAHAFAQEQYLDVIQKIGSEVNDMGYGIEARTTYPDSHGRCYFSTAVANKPGYLLTVHRTAPTKVDGRDDDEVTRISQEVSNTCTRVSSYMQDGQFNAVTAFATILEQIGKLDPLASTELVELTTSAGVTLPGASEATEVTAIFIASDALPETRNLNSFSEYPASIRNTTGKPLASRVRTTLPESALEAVDELVRFFDGEADVSITRSDILRAGIELATAEPPIIDFRTETPTLNADAEDGKSTTLDVRTTNQSHEQLKAHAGHVGKTQAEMAKYGVYGVLELFSPRLPDSVRNGLVSGVLDDKAAAHTVLEQSHSPLTQVGFAAA